jgi:hypothetical protein
MSSPVSRRDFVAGTSTLALGAMMAPRGVLASPGFDLNGVRPVAKPLNIAMVGIGGMGMSNMTAVCQTENIVAVCDVDFAYVERSLNGRLRPRTGEPTADSVRIAAENAKLGEAYKNAKKYADFREMLDKQKDIEAVMIATPDHMHATIALAAMKAGKHVYVQKPLAYSVHETRLLLKAAQDNPHLATQMGNQGHSMEGSHRISEVINSGILGKIHEGACVDGSSVRYWAQGIPRPRPATAAAATASGSAPAAAAPPAAPNTRPQWNMGTVDNAVRAAMALNEQTPPEGMNWDLYLGAAPEIPYHPVYHPYRLAWLDRLWRRLDRRHGRAPDRSAVHVARPHVANEHRRIIEPVGWRQRESGVVPDGDVRAVRVPEGRQARRREVVLVRRWPHAAAARDATR